MDDRVKLVVKPAKTGPVLRNVKNGESGLRGVMNGLSRMASMISGVFFILIGLILTPLPLPLGIPSLLLGSFFLYRASPFFRHRFLLFLRRHPVLARRFRRVLRRHRVPRHR